MILDSFIRLNWNKDKIIAELDKLYFQLQRCEECELCKIDVNRIRKLKARYGEIPVLVVSQNPSYWWYRRNPNLTDVAGNLERLDKFFSNRFTEFLRLNGLKSYNDNFFFITNVVKCCTENNKPPSRRIAKICGRKWLLKEIEIIRPKVLIVLGKLAKEFIKELGLEKYYSTVFLPHPGAVRDEETFKAFCRNFVDGIFEAIEYKN